MYVYEHGCVCVCACNGFVLMCLVQIPFDFQLLRYCNGSIGEGV